jgi:hypothetical protein
VRLSVAVVWICGAEFGGENKLLSELDESRGDPGGEPENTVSAVSKNL